MSSLSVATSLLGPTERLARWPGLDVPTHVPYLVGESAGDREHRLDLGGEHQIALDLELAAHEQHRAGGVAGHQAHEVDPVQGQGDPRLVLGVVACDAAP